MTVSVRRWVSAAAVLVAVACATVAPAPAATAHPLYWSVTKANGAILFDNPQVIRKVETEIIGADCTGLGGSRTVKTQQRYRNFRCALVVRRGYRGAGERVTIYLRTRTARTWCWNDRGLEQLVASPACRSG
jgi:hypothetical protein